jgi:hypothetical protein
MSDARMLYEVAIREEGKTMIGGGVNNPCEGLLSFKRRWTRITPRPVGLARAKRLADEQPGHAVVCVWGSADKAHDNGKPPIVPAGWWAPDARSAFDPKP